MADSDHIPLSSNVKSELNENETNQVEITLDDILFGPADAYPMSSHSDVELELNVLKKMEETKQKELILDDCSYGLINSDPKPSSSSLKSESDDFEIKTEDKIKQEELILDDTSSSLNEDSLNISQGIVDQPDNKTTGAPKERAERITTKRKLKKKKVTLPYKCKECNFKTNYRSNFHKHAINHKDKNEIKWFYCASCDYKAKIRSYLISHIKLKHKDVNKIEWHRCDHCDYKAKLKSMLTAHLLIHKKKSAETEVDGFQCKDCNYKTKLKSDLKKHAQVHKDKSDVFQCNECEFKTNYKHSMRKHTLIHKDVKKIEWFPCQDCEYKAKQRIHLINHIIRKHNKVSDDEWFKGKGTQTKAKEDDKNTKKRKSPQYKSMLVPIKRA